jgi:hypothetical protein
MHDFMYKHLLAYPALFTSHLINAIGKEKENAKRLITGGF